jgi:CPA1 family monovalent cation:H+ antiporter
MISAYAAMIATLIFRPSVAPRARSLKQRFFMPLLLGWTGMRGVVSLAAALSIPLVMNGTVIPQRHLILFITFVVILSTLLVQGLTLPYLIRRVGLSDFFAEESEQVAKQQMKQGLKQHVYQFLKDKYEKEEHNREAMERILKHWDEKANAADDSWMNEHTKVIFIELLDVQREYLEKLNCESEIDEDLVRSQLYQIDLEEERLRMI